MSQTKFLIKLKGLVRHYMAPPNSLSFVKLVKIPTIIYNLNNMVTKKKDTLW